MSQALSAAAFETFATLLKNRSGLVIGPDKLYLLETRLAPILKREQLRDLTALAEKLRSPANEAVIKQVVEAMTTNESFFFRDDKPFVHFRNQALPRLLAARGAGAPLRIWSAASSTGQEAYSIAMILTECRATVGNRIKRLEQTGVIVGYTVRLRPDAQPQEIKAWMSIAVEGDRTREVVRVLLGEPAVTSLHDTNGRWDLLAEVHAASITELSEVLERVRKIKGIETTETSIHLQTFCSG